MKVLHWLMHKVGWFAPCEVCIEYLKAFDYPQDGFATKCCVCSARWTFQNSCIPNVRGFWSTSGSRDNWLLLRK